MTGMPRSVHHGVLAIENEDANLADSDSPVAEMNNADVNITSRQAFPSQGFWGVSGGFNIEISSDLVLLTHVLRVGSCIVILD